MWLLQPCPSPPCVPTFALIILRVEIDGKVMGLLRGHKRDLSAAQPPRTPGPHLLGEVSLESLGPPCGKGPCGRESRGHRHVLGTTPPPTMIPESAPTWPEMGPTPST